MKEPATPADLAKLCRVGNQGWPRHRWGDKGICERCGAVLPPIVLSKPAQRPTAATPAQQGGAQTA